MSQISHNFETITQFIDPNPESKTNSQLYKKNACCFFSIITACDFIKTKDMSKTKHEQNIYTAIANNILNQNNDMTFDQLLTFTDLKKNDIMATTVELIFSGELGYDMIFPDIDKNKHWAIIFLKNSKFFVVMYKDGIYGIRDCHECFQYNFGTKDELINHLNVTYQFNTPLIVDGFPIPEFSSIEYIKIDKQFSLQNLASTIQESNETCGFYIRNKKYYEDSEETFDSELIKKKVENQNINNNKNNYIEYANDIKNDDINDKYNDYNDDDKYNDYNDDDYNDDNKYNVYNDDDYDSENHDDDKDY